jgi:hypothetical protein
MRPTTIKQGIAHQGTLQWSDLCTAEKAVLHCRLLENDQQLYQDDLFSDSHQFMINSSLIGGLEHFFIFPYSGFTH